MAQKRNEKEEKKEIKGNKTKQIRKVIADGRIPAFRACLNKNSHVKETEVNVRETNNNSVSLVGIGHHKAQEMHVRASICGIFLKFQQSNR